MSHQDPTPPDVRLDEPSPQPRLPRKVGTRRVMRKNDPEGDALKEFSGALLSALEPILPTDRAEYHVP